MRTIALAILLACGQSDYQAGQYPPQPQEPNVLLIVWDDLSADDPAATPEFDALALQGVRYDRLYASPVCSSSRWMLHFGENRVSEAGDPCDPNGNSASWPATGKPSIASDFHGITSLVGKWHLGRHDEMAQPWELSAQFVAGFDEWRAGIPKNIISPDCPPIGTYTDWLRVESGASFRETQYQTAVCEAVALEEIAQGEATDVPWFVMVSFQSAHKPFHSPPGTGPHSSDRARFAAMVRDVDAATRRLIDAVDLTETCVIIVSDNGTPTEAKWAGGPPPSKLKTSVYETGIKVKGTWIGYGAGEPRVEDGLVSFIDLRSMIAARSSVPPARDHVFTGTDILGQDRLAIVYDRMKYAEIDGVQYLFDLLVDPTESVNLVTLPEHAVLVASSAQLMDAEDPRN